MIPRFIDPDGSDDLVKIIHSMPLTWATLPDQSRVQITPLGFNEVGIHSAKVRLYDLGDAIYDMPITITVINDNPIFRSKPLDVTTVVLNQSTNINFTSKIFDYESHEIYLTVKQKDTAGNFIAPQYFVSQIVTMGHVVTINAVSLDDIGEHKIWLKIEDGGGVGFDLAEVTVNITNWAPFFVDGYRPQNHSIKMNNTFIYILPKYADRENNPV